MRRTQARRLTRQISSTCDGAYLTAFRTKQGWEYGCRGEELEALSGAVGLLSNVLARIDDKKFPRLRERVEALRTLCDAPSDSRTGGLSK